MFQYEIRFSSNGILLVHINAVSLCSNYDKIVDMLAKLKPHSSILFVSETKLHDSKIKQQLKQIRIDGYRIVYENSSSNAGGAAIYVSDDLSFKLSAQISNLNIPTAKHVSLRLNAIHPQKIQYLVPYTGIQLRILFIYQVPG